MNSIGMTRRIDALGRIVIPAELRRILEIRVGDLLDIRVDDGNVVLAKVEQSCVFCRAGDDLHPYREKLVCSDCVERLSGSYEPSPAGRSNGTDGIATASS
jgi:transcriptional pleiotropic regulator of transition state genes